MNIRSLCLALLLVDVALAQSHFSSSRYIQQHEENQKALTRHTLPTQNVQLSTQKAEQVKKLIKNEPSCFVIQSVELKEDKDNRYFLYALKSLLHELEFKSGDCLGEQAITQIITGLQNKVIERGYSTSRVSIEAQDLSAQKLVLTIHAGKVGKVYFTEQSPNRLLPLNSGFTLEEGDVFDLFALEQGLENLRRAPSAQVNVDIVPHENLPYHSNIVIDYQQRKLPLRLALNFDNSGNNQTGKYQGNVTLSGDNILGLSEIFYVNYNHDFGKKQKFSDSQHNITKGGTHGNAFHFSLPIGNASLSLTHNNYNYTQAIAGYIENYRYSGDSKNTELELKHLLYRNEKSKTYVKGKLWKREAHTYLNDTEIDVQYRRTGGWELGVEHTHFIKDASLYLGLSYRRGTGMFSSLPALESMFGEASERARFFHLDVSLYQPFFIQDLTFAFDSQIRAQLNQGRLTPQDQFSIGGRYSVRGFDGSLTLMGDRGVSMQNTLAWNYKDNHQFYFGLDAGYVDSEDMFNQVGRTLVGAGLGLRGNFPLKGTLSYDVFVGTPLYKPEYFVADKFAININFTYQL